ncbi:unnamed protein product [Boreogadus saida]
MYTAVTRVCSGAADGTHSTAVRHKHNPPSRCSTDPLHPSYSPRLPVSPSIGQRFPPGYDGSLADLLYQYPRRFGGPSASARALHAETVDGSSAPRRDPTSRCLPASRGEISVRDTLLAPGGGLLITLFSLDSTTTHSHTNAFLRSGGGRLSGFRVSDSACFGRERFPRQRTGCRVLPPAERLGRGDILWEAAGEAAPPALVFLQRVLCSSRGSGVPPEGLVYL